MKTCTKCGIEKELTEFGKHSRNKDGLRLICKKCRSAETKEEYTRNKNTILDRNSIYRNNNKNEINNKRKEKRLADIEKAREFDRQRYSREKEIINKRQKEYYIKNRDNIIMKVQKYASENKEKVSEDQKSYRINNKEKLNKYSLSYMNERRKNDIEFKVSTNLRRAFNQKMRMYSNSGKTRAFFKYTGLHYSEYIEYFKTTQPEEFNLYLQKGAYHIDHIIPCALYDFTDEEEIKKCWHPHNLRIIPAKDNIIKSNKLCLQLVDKYNIRHLLPKEVI